MYVMSLKVQNVPFHSQETEQLYRRVVYPCLVFKEQIHTISVVLQERAVYCLEMPIYLRVGCFLFLRH